MTGVDMHDAAVAIGDRVIVGICGSQGEKSRTRLLVKAIADAVARAPGWRAELFDLSGIGQALGAASGRVPAVPELDRIWTAIETCDALIVGSPTYKASYAGLLKHLFDLMDMKALAGRPVAVCATGKAPQHALMIEHQMKPLFGFFAARVVPTGIYATDLDFLSDGAPASALLDRAAGVAGELLALQPPSREAGRR